MQCNISISHTPWNFTLLKSKPASLALARALLTVRNYPVGPSHRAVAHCLATSRGIWTIRPILGERMYSSNITDVTMAANVMRARLNWRKIANDRITTKNWRTKLPQLRYVNKFHQIDMPWPNYWLKQFDSPGAC